MGISVKVSAQQEERYVELQHLALQYAREGEASLLLPLLQHGMPVNLSDHKGNSLIMLASYYGQIDTVNILLKAGADPNRVNDRGQTPISGAIFKGYTDVVEALFIGGARLHRVTGVNSKATFNVSSKTEDSKTTDVLQLAALFGQKEMLKLLRKLVAEEEKANQGKAITLNKSVTGKVLGLSPELVVVITNPLMKALKLIFLPLWYFYKLLNIKNNK